MIVQILAQEIHINYFELLNCKDKAISVGEKSILNLVKADIIAKWD